MKIFAHQPHFLPWVPYLFRLIKADIYLCIDSAPFKKGYYQNRTVIPDELGRKSWATLPVRFRHGVPINEVLVSVHAPARKKLSNKLISCCADDNSDINRLIMEIIVAIDAHSNLAELNIELLNLVLSYLGETKEIIRISSLSRKRFSKNDLTDVFRDLGATEIMTGDGGMIAAHPVDEWIQNGSKITQCSPTPDFIFGRDLRNQGLSCLVEFIECSREKSLSLIESSCDTKVLYGF